MSVVWCRPARDGWRLRRAVLLVAAQLAAVGESGWGEGTGAAPVDADGQRVGGAVGQFEVDAAVEW